MCTCTYTNVYIHIYKCIHTHIPQVLTLRDNHFSEPPDFLSALVKLKSLTLGQNKLQKIGNKELVKIDVPAYATQVRMHFRWSLIVHVFPLDFGGLYISVGFWWFTYFRWILVVYIFPLDFDGSHIFVGFWWFTYFRWILVVYKAHVSKDSKRKLDKDVRGQNTSTEVACMYATDGSFQITLTDMSTV